MHNRVPLAPSPARRWPLGLALSALLSALAGCGTFGWLANAVGGGFDTVQVPAQYRGLQDKSVAVMVSADDTTLMRHPEAPLSVCQAVSAQLAGGVSGARLADPRQVMQFQQANPHWEAFTYGQLMDRLKVERLIHVDLYDYSTNEPGNQDLWQGLVAGRVTVAAAEGNPTRGVFATDLSVRFPENNPVGMLNADRQVIQKGMLEAFSRRLLWLFVDHQESREE